MGNDNDNNQNNNQNNGGGGKNKGGGGGGGGSGLSLNAKFDAAAPGSLDNLQGQIIGHASNSVGFIVGAVVAGVVCMVAKKAMGVKDAAPAQGGGGNGPINPGQLTGALFNLKKSDPAKFDEIMGKVNPPA